MRDEIARLDPGFVRRAAAEGRDDLDRPVLHDHRQAEARIIAVDHGFEPVQIGPVEIGRMRIKRGQHPIDHAVDQRLIVDFLDIACLDPLIDRENLGKFRSRAPFDLGEARRRGGNQRKRGDERGAAGEFGEFHLGAVQSCLLTVLSLPGHEHQIRIATRSGPSARRFSRCSRAD
jgi:hypothetical protein